MTLDRRFQNNLPSFREDLRSLSAHQNFAHFHSFRFCVRVCSHHRPHPWSSSLRIKTP